MNNVKRRGDNGPLPFHSHAGGGLRVLLYIGSLRPRSEPDRGLHLLEQLRESRHHIVGLIMSESDRLTGPAQRMGIRVIALPREMSHSSRMIKDRLRRERDTRARIREWIRGLKELQPDIGVVFYGHWIPPELFTMPAHGFLNFHPAPLPDLRGMEPDTMAILQGRKTMRGTVHRVSATYDDGPIYAYTRQMRLSKYTTPLAIFETLTDYGVYTLLRVLNRIASGKAVPRVQRTHHEQDATRKKVRKESTIRWMSDSLELIDRRRRAFLGQDIGIRLKANIAGALYVVDDLETHSGSYPGKPGDVLGRYEGPGPFRHALIVRARDGIAIVRVGLLLDNAWEGQGKEPASRYMLPPGRRAKQTLRRIAGRSIRNSRKW